MTFQNKIWNNGQAIDLRKCNFSDLFRSLQIIQSFNTYLKVPVFPVKSYIESLVSGEDKNEFGKRAYEQKLFLSGSGGFWKERIDSVSFEDRITWSQPRIQPYKLAFNVFLPFLS